jgi:uncharacterized membrane protein YhdT
MDMTKLTTGDKIIGVSGVLLFVFSFFKWLGVKVDLRGVVTVSDSKSAWSFTLTLIAVLIGIVLVAYVAAKASGVALPSMGSVTWGQVVLGLAVLAFVFILIKLIAGPSIDTGGISGVDKTRKIGIFLGLIASAGMVFGAFLNAKEAGELPGSMGGNKGGATPPTA